MVLEQLERNLEKNVVGPLLHTLYKNELRINEKLNVWANDIKILIESIVKFF